MPTNSATGKEKFIGFMALLIVSAIIGTIASLVGGGGEDPCHAAYRNDYVFYGQPGAMSEDQYCKNYNDTTYTDTLYNPDGSPKN